MMNIEIHRSQDRGVTKTAWLHSWHSFSFGNYYNPSRMNFGALRVLNEDIIEPGSGFPTHHHDNMEIVTIVLEGELEHKDTTGGHEVISPGEIQRMSAGRGLHHSEMNNGSRAVHLLQIWVEPKEQDIKPNYEIKKIRAGKNRLALAVSPVKNERAAYMHQDSKFLLGDFDKGAEDTYNPKRENGVYVFIISGEADVSGKKLKSGDAAAVTDAKEIKIAALEKSKILVMEVPME